MNANLALCHRVLTHPKPKSRKQNPNSEAKTRNYPKPKLPKSPKTKTDPKHPNPKLPNTQNPKLHPNPETQDPKCFG